MKSEYDTQRNLSLRPNAFAYNAVMKAFSNIQDPENVDKLLNELIDVQTYEDKDIGPNTDSFALAISAWANYESYCSVQNAGRGYRQSYFWLNELIKREERGDPNITVSPELFNNVLKATRISKSTEEDVLEIAMETFGSFRLLIVWSPGILINGYWIQD